MPSIQILTVGDATRAARAMLVRDAPSTPAWTAWATVAKTTSTPATFPGSASCGSTRSRCPQPRQRESATSRSTDPSRVSSRRSTRLPVSRRSLPPHAAQRQPTSSSSPETSTTATYLVHSMPSTKTTVLMTAPVVQPSPGPSSFSVASHRGTQCSISRREWAVSTPAACRTRRESQQARLTTRSVHP